MRKAVEERTIHGIKIAHEAPMISHLLFAEDSLFFMKANVAEVRVVKGILTAYEKASGQQVNFDKTTASFSRGTAGNIKELVAQELGVRVVDNPGKYLGLSTVIGHSKQALTALLRDKLSKKLQGWRGMLLSKAGREVLIKAVAQSISTYAMSVFKLPSNFCEELRSLVSNFWWGTNNGKKKIP
ncbi:uncharacterized protein LOC141654887 [Silene latifolia]|uniref:uncharacterized protein LOC141654887 n=1 Tax=Silene latifolia TaxID=37657 RepID=UPI003D76F8CD